MIIMHPLEDFIFEIFPEVDNFKNSPDKIVGYFEKFYSFGIYKPKVTIKDEIVIVNIDTETIDTQESDYKKVVALCERKKYSEAKQKLKILIEINPTISEYHRIYGQILSDEGKQEEAIDSLIDALRWDPKNNYALLMMGNIFGKYKNDFDTSMKYYEQALKTNPEDNITLNNIGANLMQLGKFEQSKNFFIQAAKINENYPNTHYALSIIAEKENKLRESFEESILALKNIKDINEIYHHSLNQAISIAKKLISSSNITAILEKYLLKLEDEGGVEVEINEDNSIETVAKFEFAENYNRNKHRLLFKSDYPAVEHLKMHELVHLDFAIEARKHEKNKLFIMTQQQKGLFIRNLEPTIKRLKKLGYDEKSISNYCSGLFNGINRQIFNTPIDLFIENFLYNSFPDLRPYQFISLYNLIREGLNAVTNKKIVDLSPKEVLSKSKIFNIISALHFRELYGIDMVKEFKASNSELKLAQKLYNDFLQKKENRGPGEEYNLVQDWARELNLDKNFELISESDFRKRTDPQKMLDSISNDPYELKNQNPEKNKLTEQFLNSQKEIGLNMAVVMYMTSALEYFDKMDKNEVRNIALEIAQLGIQGFNPEKQGYKLSLIPTKVFSGYQILAYYYISWKIAIPEMLDKLKLPYDKEYELAEQMFNK